MRLFKLFCFTVWLLFCGTISAASASRPGIDYSGFHWKDAGKIAVQAGGRVKPLDSYARELVAQTTGQARYAGQDPVATYFLWMADGEAWSARPLIYLPKGQLRHTLNLDAHTGNYFSLQELAGRGEVMSMALDGQAREQAGSTPNFVESRAIDLLNHMGSLSAVFSHEQPSLVPTSRDSEAAWQSMAALMGQFSDSTAGDSLGNPAAISDTLNTLLLAFAGLYNSVREGNAEIFNTAVSVFIEAQRAAMGNAPRMQSRLAAEHLYNRYCPFSWARGLLLAGFAAFLLEPQAVAVTREGRRTGWVTRRARAVYGGAGTAGVCGGARAVVQHVRVAAGHRLGGGGDRGDLRTGAT